MACPIDLEYMGKNLCEETIAIPISSLKKLGFLAVGFRSGKLWWGSKSSPQGSIGLSSTINENGLSWLRLEYVHTDRNDESTNHDYSVKLTITPCHLGGKRYWFVCPLTKNDKSCERRVGILYFIQGYLGCRHCAELGYEKQYKKYGGELGWAFKRLAKVWKVERDWENIRYKYWKGKPTKRFKKVLEKARRMGVIGSLQDYRNIKKL